MRLRVHRLPAKANPATPKSESTRASSLPPPGWGFGGVRGRPFAALEIISSTIVALAPGVTVEGEIEQCRSSGRFEQESETDFFQAPPMGVRMMRALLEDPDATDKMAGDTPRLSAPLTVVIEPSAHCALNTTGADI